MVPIVPHPMTPHNLSLLEQELASNLHRVASSENIPPTNTFGILQTLRDRVVLTSDPSKRRNVLHVIWSRSPNVQADLHAQLLKELSGRIGKDGEGAVVREGLVVLDDVRLAAADHDNARRCRDAEVLAHRYAICQRFEVSLAGAAIEVPDEYDELALMWCGVGIIKRSERPGCSFRIVDRNFVDGSESCAVRALVRVVHGEVGVGTEACKPLLCIYFSGWRTISARRRSTSRYRVVG